MSRCLYCYQLLEDNSQEYHSSCSKKFFGQPIAPSLTLTKERMEELAGEIVSKSIAVAGVQPKLSLTLDKNPNDPKSLRFTIVGLWGNYILKPRTSDFPALPEIEDLTMHLSEIARIKTAEHSLIRLESGELAYLTKRFDRNKEKKVPQEDFCQLSELLTEDKYKSSMEKVGNIIHKFSTQPGIDSISLFEQTLFMFLVGNSDMHLKNFSLIRTDEGGIILSPAYDLVSIPLVYPADKQEMALTLNAKKNRIKRLDFDRFSDNLKLNSKTIKTTYERFENLIPEFYSFIDISFLSEEMKLEYKNLINSRAKRLLNI
ncbi:MAG TPA: HipA domain-containing protein [Cytophagaceae bacterium]|jgi:serine/threonine-protein kinase HipA|nr:HipA domain-containing protein [Cytophagaceae bacterium]